MTKDTPRRKRGRYKTERSKTHWLPSVRVTAEQYEAVWDVAAQSGLSMATNILVAVFRLPPPPASKRPSLDQKLAAAIVAKLGKLGGNLNQIAKAANYGNAVAFQETLEHWAEIKELKLELRALIKQGG